MDQGKAVVPEVSACGLGGDALVDDAHEVGEALGLQLVDRHVLVVPLVHPHELHLVLQLPVTGPTMSDTLLPNAPVSTSTKHTPIMIMIIVTVIIIIIMVIIIIT
jgi:hypothetical protein